MSGGHFDYNQWNIRSICEELERIIDTNEYGYSNETIEEFKKGLEYLRLAEIYTQRIDWLVSCDDCEDTFHERLKEDLNNAQI